MKFDIYSDAHVDTWGNNFDFIPHDDSEDVYAIFAGDAGNTLGHLKGVEKKLKAHYKDVFSVPGNHEWYRQNELVDLDRSTFVVRIDDVKIVGATLWTNFRNNPMCEIKSQAAISDFMLIPGMTPAVMQSHFEDNRKFLLNHKDADVVVTHFPPVIQSVHKKYGNDILNGYFVNDDEALVNAMSPKVWVHGHTHSVFDYTLNDVRIVSNPRGYPNENFTNPEYHALRVEI